jgi:hypothetical protein
MPVRFCQRISYQQARNTVLVTFLLGIVLSVTQIGYDLFRERQQVDATVTAMIGMLKDSAVQAVYEIHKPLAERVVDGLFEYAPIRAAHVMDEFGVVLARKERPAVAGRFRWLVAPFWGREEKYTIPLMYDPQRMKGLFTGIPQRLEETRLVGHLTVSVDQYLIASSFFRRAGLVIISDLIRNIVLASVLMVIFYRFLTRPLLDMVKSLASVNIADPAGELVQCPRGHEHDELGLIIRTDQPLARQAW